eukprot:7937651-Pyramimonas_sp.AAC.1
MALGTCWGLSVRLCRSASPLPPLSRLPFVSMLAHSTSCSLAFAMPAKSAVPDVCEVASLSLASFG